MTQKMSDPLPHNVVWLGYGGLLPFIGLTMLIALDRDRQLLWSDALISYGAVILSFVGALHWAFAMLLPGLTSAQRRHRFIWSTLPALVAWLSLMLAMNLAMPLLIAGFAFHYLQDRQLVACAPLPDWYLPLRLRLSTVACISLAIAALIGSL